jgi:hypothetical protein
MQFICCWKIDKRCFSPNALKKHNGHLFWRGNGLLFYFRDCINLLPVVISSRNLITTKPAQVGEGEERSDVENGLSIKGVGFRRGDERVRKFKKPLPECER